MRILTALIVLLLPASYLLAGEAYQSSSDFLDEVFSRHTPEASMLWLKDEIKTDSTEILGHPYPGLRIRYWLQEPRSAWILEEIGKEKPITVGLVVNGGKLEKVRILAFRESRGWEVRHPFFTRQFDGVGLTAEQQLDHDIDGISGATLSVRALEKLARLALYFDRRIHTQHDPHTP